MILSNILFIIHLFILVDISPFHLFRRCLYTGNVQVFKDADLVAVSRVGCRSDT